MKKAKVKLIEGGKPPVKGSEKASCWDLFAREVEFKGGCVQVYLGVSIEPPEGYDVRLYPRSSISKTGWILANSVGIGDEDYRGEYRAIFYDVSNFYDYRKDLFPYEVGDRCIQMEFKKKDEVEIEIVDELSETKRGEGGFGSTGR